MNPTYTILDSIDDRVQSQNLSLSEAAYWLLTADGHNGEIHQGQDGWWVVLQDDKELIGLGSHRTAEDAQRAVVFCESDWSGFHAEPQDDRA